MSAATLLATALLFTAAPGGRPPPHASPTAAPAFAKPVPSLARDTTERDTTERSVPADDTTEGAPADDSAPARVRPALQVAPSPGRSAGALAADTLAADTLAADTLYRVRRYRPARSRGSALFPAAPPTGRRTADLLPPRPSFWRPRLGTRYEHRLTLDSTGRALTASERIGDEAVAPPLQVHRAAYRRARHRADLRASWAALRREHQQRRNQRRGGLGVSIAVPGGRESAFTTIFGKNEVALDINGQADINAGFNYRRSDQQAQLTGSPTQLNPDFKQDLRLGITGTIGDKLRVDVNWDTQSQFDYQNQVRLRYTGYEDEIIQSVEAGNVFLESPSTLIDGGQSLFGIKSEFQLGGLHLTTVASQQEGQSNTLTIEGGSERTEFDFSALDYDDRRHFFLAYYFRNNWNYAHHDPQALLEGINGLSRILDLEVWRVQTSHQDNEESVRNVVALVDLGEPAELLTAAAAYDDSTRNALPRSELDQYEPNVLAQLRATESDAASILGGDLASRDHDLAESTFKLLDESEYTYDDQLGYISLRQRLRDNEALAVAFRYEANGQTYEVGDFASDVPSGERLVLKLLRPANLPAPQDQPNAAWYLQLRNIYELRGRQFNADGFELDLQYHPPGGTAQSSLPGLSSQRTLLQMLGLDRLDSDGSPRTDGRFDFLPRRTINREEGLLIFPYLQPFGHRLRQVIESQAPPGQQQPLLDQYVFSQLYHEKPRTLQSAATETNLYHITGSSKGTAQEFYDLQAFNGVVEGSVRVTSNGTPLTEGSDYQVDYQGGTVTILNDDYLGSGSEIEIDYEKNALVNLQKKTLLGARADYRFRDDLIVGATLMRLSQRSPADKLRIGQEPIANTIWGVDGALALQPRWLTRAVDALPLVQTKASSSLELSAEFAQLRPGYNQTQAFERTRRRLQDEGRDFTDDELNGISYLDDFEGFENNFSLKAQLQNWRLAAPPANYAPPTAPVDSSSFGEALAANNWRGTLAWYQLNNNIVEALSEAPSYNDDLKRLVRVREVFPNRDTRAQVDNTLRTLDFYFDPARRGPYNYTDDLQGFLNRPEETWGGITMRLPEGQKDFGVNNIEFVEFVFKPYPKGNGTAGNAVLYLDLGKVSEDIIPNGRTNDEDGLSLTSFGDLYPDGRSREPIGSKAQGTVDIEGDVTEDLGLDGLASYAGPDLYGAGTEEAVFSSFLDNLPGGGPSRLRAEVARARRDPSGDDYHFYEEEAFFQNQTLFPGGASFQDRFSFYHSGLELNSYQTQNTLSASYTSGRGNTRDPDAESFAFDRPNQQGRYFQYHIPLSEEILQTQAAPGTPDDFIVGEIKDADGTGTGWYQARIPVRTPTDSIGAPELSSVEHLRLWTTGHRTPITLRFATLELVGSQWRKSERVAADDDTSSGLDESRLTIASINNEEDSGIYKRPRRAVVGQQQTASGGRQNSREQSLIMRVKKLKRGQRRAIYKNVQNLNLLKYGGLRMFAHLHSATGDYGEFMGDEEAARQEVELFVRLGANETSDYYEYRQPLTPTLGDLGTAPVERLWYPLDTGEPGLANEMNLRLTALNQLKVARDRENVSTSEVFWSNTDSTEVVLTPSLESFAPQGAKIGIKGTPSLQNVSTIVIGLRVSEDAARFAYEDLTLWANELRATGYDEKSGWKALANARIRLADVAEIDASFQRQTDGWGALASTLEERQQNRLLNWNVRTRFFADKLLPATSGWRIPISFSFGSKTSTPRYAPNRGDVRLDALLTQAGERSGLTEAAVLQAAQTHVADRQMNVSIQKSGSNTPWLRYTLDNLSLSYNYSQSSARTPSRQVDDRWNWSSTLDYQYSFERAHTVRPLWFLENVPLVGGLGGLRFNYAPQSIRLNGDLARNASHSQDRPTRLLARDDHFLREPMRDAHSFDHERQFELNYNPFDFLRLSFNTRTEQNLNRAGADEEFRVLTPEGHVELFDSDSAAVRHIDDALAADSTLTRDAFLKEQRLNMYGVGESFGRLLEGTGLRTNRYTQRFIASLDLPFGDSEALNWIDFEDVSYQAIYGWNNGPRGRRLGAGVSNDVTIRSGIVLHPQQLWRKFGFYRRLEQQQEEAERSDEETERAQGSEDEEDDAAPAEAPPEAPTEDEGPPEDDEDQAERGRERSFSDLPLPNPVHLLRRTVLALTGLRDFTVQYQTSRRSESSHVGVYTGDDAFSSGSHTLLGALRGDGPPLGYRFGFDRQIGMDLRPNSSDQFSLEDHLQDSNKLSARTTLQFSDALQVDLNWTMDWQQTTTFSNLTGDRRRTLRGSNASSIWTFGGSYRSFFERQMEKEELTNTSMSETFRNAFATSLGTAGEGDFLSLPLPSWQVTYTGLSDWPLLRSLTQSVRLTHGYTAEYASDYRTVTSAPASDSREEGVDAPTTLRFESQHQSVQERFQPLLGLDVSWNGALRTNVEWSRTHGYQLRPASEEIAERRADELSVTANYRTQGLSLSFLPFVGDLNNQLTFSLTASRLVDHERDFLVRDAFDAAQAAANSGLAFDPATALEGNNVSVRTASTRLLVTPKVSYRFSNRIAADFMLRYERFEGNRRPSYNNIDGGFNVRVSLQE